MNVLILTNHMADFGGSEIVALEVAEYFVKRGDSVLLYSNYIANRMEIVLEQSGIPSAQANNVPNPFSYDLVWAQHDVLPILLASHEFPEAFHTRFISAHLSPFEPMELTGVRLGLLIASRFVANSPETAQELYRLQVNPKAIAISHNACPDEFFQVSERNRNDLERLLVISNHIPAEVVEAVSILENRGVTCLRIGFGALERRVAPGDMSWADAVLTIGKSVQYALAAGRPVYCYDHFGGPGWLHHGNFDEAEWYNFSGRPNKSRRSGEEIARDVIDGYNIAARAASEFRNRIDKRYRLSIFLDQIVSQSVDFRQDPWTLDPSLRARCKREVDLEIYSALAIAREYRYHRISANDAADQHSRALRLELTISDQLAHSAEELSICEHALEESERLLAHARTEISALHASKSWRITAPLRLAARVLRSVSDIDWWNSKSRSMLRVLYQRFFLLRLVRTRYLTCRNHLISMAREGWSQKENLEAIRALTERRFLLPVSSDLVLGGTSCLGEASLPMLDLSIVTYNSRKWLERFLDSLGRQNYPLERMNVVMVDNGSTDGSVEEFERLVSSRSSDFASVRIIRQSNLGFGCGHDRAIREGSADYILVTNVDLEFQFDSITNVVRAAQSDLSGEVACWEFRQIPYEHPKYYDAVTLETNWCSHACVLMRRGAYAKVGGYDPKIFMYAEDVELSYRYRSFGYRLKYVPTAVVRHDTYAHEGEIKPMQWLGSTLGNVYVRARYGDRSARLAGLILYGSLFALPAPFPGARRELLSNLSKLLLNWRHFRHGKGSIESRFPFRAFDYELRREGAFVQAKPLPNGPLPLVSIITRTYDGRQMFLRQALASIINQVYPNIEMIVVQDGGNSLYPIAEETVSDLRPGCKLKFIANPKLGRSEAGNAGLAAAEGEFMMFLDDDDLLFADHVSTLVTTLIEKQSAAAAYGLSMQVETTLSSDGDRYVEDTFGTPDVFFQEWDYNVLLDHNYIPIQAIIFRRSLYEERGGFNVQLDQLEDWHLWLRYGYKSVFEYVPKTTSLFRIPGSEDRRLERARKLHAAYDQVKADALSRISMIGG